MSTLLMLGCDYEEFEPQTYKGVYLYDDEELDRFNSGDILKDIESACIKYKGRGINFSSSIDNYLMDAKIDNKKVWKLYEKLGIQ